MAAKRPTQRLGPSEHSGAASGIVAVAPFLGQGVRNVNDCVGVDGKVHYPAGNIRCGSWRRLQQGSESIQRLVQVPSSYGLDT